jgi:hypothetical protein
MVSPLTLQKPCQTGKFNKIKWIIEAQGEPCRIIIALCGKTYPANSAAWRAFVTNR